MDVRRLSVRVEADESVSAVYARDLDAMPDALFLRVGSLHIVGRPHVLMEALTRAVQECLQAWASGYQDAAGDGPSVTAGNREKVTALPPLVDQPVVDDALSRVGPWADGRRPLALDGGAASADPLRFSGGGIRTSFYLIRNEAERGV